MIYSEQWQRKSYENIFVAYDPKKLVALFIVKNAVEEKQLHKTFNSLLEFYRYLDAFQVECGLMNFKMVRSRSEPE